MCYLVVLVNCSSFSVSVVLEFVIALLFRYIHTNSIYNTYMLLIYIDVLIISLQITNTKLTSKSIDFYIVGNLIHCYLF